MTIFSWLDLYHISPKLSQYL